MFEGLRQRLGYTRPFILSRYLSYTTTMCTQGHVSSSVPLNSERLTAPVKLWVALVENMVVVVRLGSPERGSSAALTLAEMTLSYVSRANLIYGGPPGVARQSAAAHHHQPSCLPPQPAPLQHKKRRVIVFIHTSHSQQLGNELQVSNI